MDLAPQYSISEYDIGCENQIEGGVAEADLLGVFGREGLFAATIWPLTAVVNGSALVNYPIAAFDIYRNYDGAGSVVGDTTVYAATSDVADTSVYAFTSSSHAGEVDLVLINKLSTKTSVAITIEHAPTLTTAKAYNLVTGTVGVTSASTSPTVACNVGGCTATYTMPATSATTLVLK
jgi:mannan endo-1,4-beta-mannosidase